MNKKVICLIYNWLVQRILRLHPDMYCFSLLMKVFTVLKTRGKPGVIDFCKKNRLSLYSYLEKVSNHDLDKHSVGISPSLRFLKRYDNSEIITRLRLVLSILSISRGIHLDVKPDLHPITEVSLRSIKLSEIGKYRFDFWKELGYRPRKSGVSPRSLTWSRFHLTTHSGPNGHGLWSAASDLLSLTSQQKEDISIIGGEKLGSLMCTLENGLKYTQLFDFFKAKIGVTRKLTPIPQPEGKTRIVAILDYWSQTALRPLHRYLFNCLKKIRQDCTFDQGSFLAKLPVDSGEVYDSVDLTAATDRFPIQLIALVLRAQLGNTYVSAWTRLMVDTPFVMRGSEEMIYYRAGNPMGAYSSWASFAVAHHYVMYYCCRELGISWKDSEYCLLGDDIVIRNPALTRKYKEVIYSLGVRFSEPKSHTSKHFFEFAKRPHWSGEEISPFPIAGLASTWRTPSMMASVLLNEHGKGWDLKERIPDLLSELWSLNKLPRTLIRSRAILITTSLHLLEILKGKETAEASMKKLLEKYFPDLVIRGDAGGVYDSFLTVPVIQSFSDSFNRFNESTEPFGSLAFEAVIIATSIDDKSFNASDLIASIPFLAVHGQVEETYLRVRTKIKDRSTHSSWKNDLRSMTTPISDKVYHVRNQDLAMVSSFRLSKLVLKAISTFSILNDTKLPSNLKVILGRFPQLAKSYRGCSPMECLFS